MFLKNKLIKEGGQWWQEDQLRNYCCNQVRENSGLEVEKCLDPRSILKEQSAGQVIEYERQIGIKNKDYSTDFDLKIDRWNCMLLRNVKF